MNSLHSLALELKIPHSFLENYKTYVGITSKQMDKQLAASASNVFASRIISHADNKVYNDYDTAYAVAMIIYLLIEQNIEVFINQFNKELSFQKFTLLFIFVPLQQDMALPYLLGAQQITAFDSHSVDSSLPVLYQPDKSSPILVIIKPDIVEIQKTVFLNHLKFLKEISIQLVFDAISQNKKLSFFSECLKFQPFRFQKIEQLAASIFEDQYNYQDRCVQFLQIPNIQQTLAFLIDPQFNIDFTRKQLMQNTETTFDQEKTDGSLQQDEPDFNVFQTQKQQLSKQILIRKTTFH